MPDLSVSPARAGSIIGTFTGARSRPPAPSPTNKLRWQLPGWMPVLHGLMPPGTNSAARLCRPWPTAPQVHSCCPGGVVSHRPLVHPDTEPQLPKPSTGVVAGQLCAPRARPPTHAIVEWLLVLIGLCGVVFRRDSHVGYESEESVGAAVPSLWGSCPRAADLAPGAACAAG